MNNCLGELRNKKTNKNYKPVEAIIKGLEQTNAVETTAFHYFSKVLKINGKVP